MLTFAQRCSVTRHHHKQRSNLSQTRSLRSLGNLASAAEQAAAISITRSFAIVFRVDWYAHWHKNTNLPTVDFVRLLSTQLNVPQQVAKSLLLNLLATDTFSAAISFVVSPAEQRVAAEPHIQCVDSSRFSFRSACLLTNTWSALASIVGKDSLLRDKRRKPGVLL